MLESGRTKVGCGSTVLITGGTGSFGQAFTRYLLENHLCKRVIIYSRDERKQAAMADWTDFRVDYFLGDVRDYERLRWALEAGVDLIIHAAALKRVDAAEYNPFETVKTNVMGAAALIQAAHFAKVKKVIAISTDKAVNPINLYGSTKLTAEKLFIAGNIGARTKFSVVRWGNVFGSRGSVIERIATWRKTKKVELTDVKMTRFWIRVEDVCRFLHAVEASARGGEIFIPELPAASVARIAKILVPEATRIITGARPGEKLHETLVSEGETVRTKRFIRFPSGRAYVIEPVNPPWAWRDYSDVIDPSGIEAVEDDFEYRSDVWPTRLEDAEIERWYDEWDAKNGKYDLPPLEPVPSRLSDRMD